MKNIFFGRERKNLNLVLICLLVLVLSLFISTSTVWANGQEDAEKADSSDIMLVGMVDLTLLFNNPSGNIEETSADDQFKEEIVVNGRTAFFLKGKIKGKYILTASLDTGQGELNELWQDIFKQDVGNTITRIDPDRYYPVYGDNSSLANMADSQGKLYVDLAWDNTELLWGNYFYYITNSKLLKFNRSLYGLKFKTVDKREGEIEINSFWSEPESIHSYNELNITGGMLYYLKHGNLVVGSESIKIEVRDNLTGAVEGTKELTAGLDYDLDYLSGRILINSSIGRIYIFDEEDEKSSYLVADYEYEPIEDLAEQSSYGFNMTAEDQGAALSGSYITEITPAGKRYRSGDIAYNYQNNDSSFTVEWANSKNKQANQYLSEDGGMTYNLLNNADEVNKANAYLVNYQKDLNQIYSKLPGLNMLVEYTHKDEGFSSQQNTIEEDTNTINLQLKGSNEKTTYQTGYYSERKKESGQNDTINLKVKNQVNDKLQLSGELKKTTTINDGDSSDDEDQISTDLGLTYKMDEKKELYGSQKLSINDNSINKTTLGARVAPRENINLEAALTLDNSSTADNNNKNIKLGGSYNYKYGQIYSDYITNGVDNSVLLGGKTTVNKKTDLYIEHKNTNDSDEDSQSNVFGVKYMLNDKWNFAFDYSRSNVSKADNTELSRDILTPALLYRDDNLTYKAKMEYRRDIGDEKLNQYVFTSGLKMAYNDEVSLLANLDYSLTKGDNAADKKDNFKKAQLGLAYRPVQNDRLNLLAMYTYKEEYKPADQDNVSEYNEQSNIFSVEGIYDLNSSWQLGEKAAWRNSKIISDDIAPASDTYLWINRLSYNPFKDWDLYGEYRILKNTQAEDQKNGFLLGVNKEFPQNMKLGLGYNFTDFNDDLTDLSYEAKGWFVNLIKAW